MSTLNELRTEPGVLTAPGEEPRFAASLLVNDDETEIQVIGNDGVESMKVSRIDQDENSGRLVLSTKKVKYSWRPLREADGTWLSRLHVPVPVEAIPGIAAGDVMATEMLSAFSSGDSPYVLGVVYETADGQWVRSGGSFLPIAGDDTTYSDMDRIVIDPDKAKDFLDLYDRNYVSVSDAVTYEAPSAE